MATVDYVGNRWLVHLMSCLAHWLIAGRGDSVDDHLPRSWGLADWWLPSQPAGSLGRVVDLLLFAFMCVVFMALLYECPGGNQVDGLPPAQHLKSNAESVLS